MAFDRETGGSQLVDARGAGFHLIHFLAVLAEEVMVMLRVLALVMRRGSRNLHDFNRAHIHKDTEGPVYCRDAQSR